MKANSTYINTKYIKKNSSSKYIVNLKNSAFMNCAIFILYSTLLKNSYDNVLNAENITSLNRNIVWVNFACVNVLEVNE